MSPKQHDVETTNVPQLWREALAYAAEHPAEKSGKTKQPRASTVGTIVDSIIRWVLHYPEPLRKPRTH